MAHRCGCIGFFHSSACSDQNVVDPYGEILDPEHRARVRAMAKDTVVVRTIVGVPVNLGKDMQLMDAVVCVDFVKIAVELAHGACMSKRKTASRMGNAILVRSTNIRPAPKKEK